jgi:F-type H+-transporting ATPase subunit delta
MNAPDRAQTYANAFYEAAFDRWLNGLGRAAVALQDNSALMQRLQASDVEFDTRQAALEGVIGAETDPLVRNLLLTLMQRGDLALLPEVTAALRQRMRLAEVEPTQVEVVTAMPLDDAQREVLESRLAQQHGPALAYAYRVDPSILGGVIVRVGDKLIDGSVASRLAAMKQALGVKSNE